MAHGSCTRLAIAALLGALLACAGCGNNAKFTTDDRMENGLVIILPGIEGHSAINESIRKGMVSAGVHRGLPIRTWGRPVPFIGLLINQMDILGNRLAGESIARSIVKYQDEHPNRPVYIVGHSAGGGVAVFAAEALPEDRKIEGLVLLSASISSSYDLQKALSRCRNGIVNFYNEGDAVLGLAVVLGNVDGGHGPSAGLVGFENFDMPGYERLYQVRMENASDSSHTTSTQVAFVSTFVAPWVVSDAWPATLSLANVDNMPPIAASGEVAATEGAGASLAAADATTDKTPDEAGSANVLTGRPISRPPTADDPDGDSTTTRKGPDSEPSRAVARKDRPKHSKPSTIDEALLARARAKNGSTGTVSPRLPTDEVLEAGTAKTAPAQDLEDQADPATIGP